MLMIPNESIKMERLSEFSAIEKKWEAFLEINSSRKLDKLTALDEFLSSFMDTCCNVDSGIRLRDLSGISGILTRHFLVDVHDVCLKSVNEDEETLMEYLLAGRGMKILYALEIARVQGITCKWELANLLLSIMAAFHNHSVNTTSKSLFSKGLRLSLNKEGDALDMLPTVRLLTIFSRNTLSKSDGSIFSQCRFTSVDGKASGIGDSSVEGLSETTRGEGRKQKPFMNSKDVLDCVFSLLDQLCQNDVRDMPSPTVSSLVLSVILELLKSTLEYPFQADQGSSSSVSSGYITQRLVALITNTGIALVQRRSGFEVLVKSELYSVMLRMVEKLLLPTASENSGDCNVEAVGNCMLGCLEVLLAASITASEGDINYMDCVRLFSYFNKCAGLKLLDQSMAYLVEAAAQGSKRSVSEHVLFQIVWTIGEIGATARRSRITWYHAELGEKNCQKKWKLHHSTHHHTLVADTSSSSVAESLGRSAFPQIPCLVASMTSSLLTLLKVCNDERKWSAILAALNKCGACCCLNLHDLFRSVVTLNCIAGCRDLGIRFLESVVIAFANYQVSFDCVVAVCHSCESRISDGRVLLQREVDGICSWNRIEFSRAFREGFWNVFDGYLELLQAADASFRSTLERHLFAVMASTNDALKLELLLRVFLPLLNLLSKQSKVKGESGNIHIENEGLIHFCLNAVIALLTLPVAYHLLNASACIGKLFPLMCSPSLRHIVLRLLRIVMLEESRLVQHSDVGSGGVSVESDAGEGGTAGSRSTSTLRLYERILLQHTIWYRDMAAGGDVVTSKDLEVEQSLSLEGDVGQTKSEHEENGDLLQCLTDLWKTLAFILDRSVVCRNLLWGRSVKTVVISTINKLILIRGATSKAIDDSGGRELKPRIETATVSTRLKWELLGTWMHIVMTCDIGSPLADSIPEVQVSETLTVFQKFRDQAFAKLTSSGHSEIGHMLRGLLSASLKTDALIMESANLSSASARKRGFPEGSFREFMGADVDEELEETSSWSSSVSSLDKGYEADAEDELHWLTVSSRTRQGGGANASLTSLSFQNEALSDVLVTCPALLRLLLNLLTEYFKICSSSESGEFDSEALTNLTSIFQALVQVATANPTVNCPVLAMECQIMSHFVLDGFRKVLSDRGIGQFDALQNHVIDLFVCCAQQNITSTELRSYLRLFLEPDGPVSTLLTALRAVVDAIKTEPPAYVRFCGLERNLSSCSISGQQGVDSLETSDGSTTTLQLLLMSSSTTTSTHATSTKSIGPSSTDAADHQAGAWVADMVSEHTARYLASGLTRAAVAGCFMQPDETSFWLGGLGISCWLHPNLGQCFRQMEKRKHGHVEDGNLEAHMHMFSCMCDGLGIEVWYHKVSASLLLKLVMSTRETHTVLDAKVTSATELVANAWQHLFVSWLGFRSDSKMVVQAFVYRDARRSDEAEKVTLECPWQEHWKTLQNRQPWHLLLGQVCCKEPFEPGAGSACVDESWFLGSLMVFRGPFSTADAPSALRELGPDCTQIELLTDAGGQQSASNKHGSQSDSSNLSTSSTAVDDIEARLLVSYMPQDVETFVWHPALRTATHVTSGLRRAAALSSLVTGRKERGGATKSVFCGHVPAQFLRGASNISVRHTCNVQAAIFRLGGASVFVCLFARIVEMHDDEDVQASCLSILVDLTRKSRSFREHFRQISGWDLVFKVLSTSRCIVGCKILSVLLGVATSEAILSYDAVDQHWKLNKSTTAVVTDVNLLSLLVKRWKLFHCRKGAQIGSGSRSILCWLLRVLELLVHDCHPKRDVNLEAFASINLVDSLLTLCKECVLGGDNQDVLQPKVCTVLCHLLTALCGKELPPKRLGQFLDFLLAIHPSNRAYVCHARTSFYFLPPDLNKTPSSAQRPAEIDMTQSVSVEQMSPGQLLYFPDLAKRTKSLANKQLRQRELLKVPSLAVYSSNSEETPPSETGVEDEDLLRVGSYSDEFVTPSCSPSAIRRSSPELRVSQEEVIHQLLTEDEDDVKVTTAEEPRQPTELSGGCETTGFNSSDLPSEEFTTSSSTDNLGIVFQGVLSVVTNTVLISKGQQLALNLEAIDPRTLVVFALHPHDGVRAAVIKAFRAYLQCIAEEKYALVHKKCLFNLLANQLYQYEATTALVEACISLVLDGEFSFESWNDHAGIGVSTKRIAAIPLLLAVLPRIGSDTVLCHNYLQFLLKLCQKQPTLYKEFAKRGFVQSLCFCLAGIMHSKFSSVDVFGKSEESLLIEGIGTVISNVMVHFIHLSGAASVHVFSDILVMLSHFEQVEAEHCGLQSSAPQAFRDCQCACFVSALASIQNYFEWSDDLFFDVFNDRINTKLVTAPTEKVATVSELQEKFRQLLHRAVDFLLFADIAGDQLFVSDYEMKFARFLFSVLLEGCLAVLNKGKSKAKSKWHMLVYVVHDSLRTQLARIFIFMLSPTQAFSQKLFALRLLLSKPRHADLVTYVLMGSTQLEPKFTTFLHVFLRDNFENIESEEMVRCLSLQNSLKEAFGHAADAVVPDVNKEKWIEETVQSKAMWNRWRAVLIEKISQKFDVLTKTIGSMAIEVTCSVTERQNQQLKLFLSHMKTQFSERLRIRQTWQALIGHLTHERAIWYHPELYPQSWELDSTEGPDRMRKRLRRCQLVVQERFLLPEHRTKLKASQMPQPFSFLLENEDNSSDRAIINDQLHNTDKIRCTYICTIVTPSIETQGELLLGNHSIYYVGEELSSLTNQNGSQKLTDIVSHTWHFEDIREILKRRFQLQDNALELFLTYGKTFLIAFSSVQERNTLYDQLMSSNLPKVLPDGDHLAADTQMWRERLMTNFEYLTQLNKVAGRTFNDLMQYPVFPFVLADYVSLQLDLSNPQSYRNLMKPMAVQDQAREQHYVNQYEFLKREQSEARREDGITLADIGPYHYGSHYSNSGIVLHFLVRLPPFTSMFLSYQDNNFDIPDRTFHSMHTCWRLASADSTTDVKELIPEFFFLPEMLVNQEGFDFGVRQSGEIVNNILLPPWCRGDPRLFVLIHRQALERPPVTEKLNYWIDLVFGYKQTGKSAIEAINVFHPATYYGFNVQQIKDQVRRNAVQTMIKTFGQTPCQLFQNAHPLVSLPLTRQHQQVTSSMEVMKEVPGLCWGRYVGSPEESEPVIIWRKRHFTLIGSFVTMITNEVFGLAQNTSLLVQYCKEKGPSVINATYVTNAALVSFGYRDGVVRLQLRRDQPSRPFIATNVIDPVTACATAPDCMLLFLGKASGNIVVHHVEFQSSKFSRHQNASVCGNPMELYGHTGRVSSIHLCKTFSIVVSASQDSTCIIWDLNKMCYVRSITSHTNPVHHACVSDTSGDIASVSNIRTGSSLMLHTINAKLIGQVNTDRVIHSLCFSSATEGISVNALCAGLDNGEIMMWSTWDLLPIRTIKFNKFSRPVICLAYSVDCQHLYAANSVGDVIICESPSKTSGESIPKFRTLI